MAFLANGQRLTHWAGFLLSFRHMKNECVLVRVRRREGEGGTLLWLWATRQGYDTRIHKLPVSVRPIDGSSLGTKPNKYVLVCTEQYGVLVLASLSVSGTAVSCGSHALQSPAAFQSRRPKHTNSSDHLWKRQ